MPFDRCQRIVWLGLSRHYAVLDTGSRQRVRLLIAPRISYSVLGSRVGASRLFSPFPSTKRSRNVPEASASLEGRRHGGGDAPRLIPATTCFGRSRSLLRSHNRLDAVPHLPLREFHSQHCPVGLRDPDLDVVKPSAVYEPGFFRRASAASRGIGMNN